MTVEIYSDIACPWCYIGHRRFVQATEGLSEAQELDVVFRPYQLDPTLSDSPIPLRERLREKFGANDEAMIRQVTTVATQEGLELRFDRALAVNTLNGHRLLRLAEQEYSSAVQAQVAEKLFAAHFRDGKNVADLDMLTELAVSTGMDGERAASYLASDEGRQEVEQAIAHAQRLGVRAVPTFVFDNQYAVQGAQSTETFRAVLDRVLSGATATSANRH